LRARVHNVLGASYEVIRNYPMPGRSVRLEVRWDNVRAPATSAS
jgi:outer membrane cobalamin receptor